MIFREIKIESEIVEKLYEFLESTSQAQMEDLKTNISVYEKDGEYYLNLNNIQILWLYKYCPLTIIQNKTKEILTIGDNPITNYIDLVSFKEDNVIQSIYNCKTNTKVVFHNNKMFSYGNLGIFKMLDNAIKSISGYVGDHSDYIILFKYCGLDLIFEKGKLYTNLKKESKLINLSILEESLTKPNIEHRINLDDIDELKRNDVILSYNGKCENMSVYKKSMDIEEIFKRHFPNYIFEIYYNLFNI